MEPEFITDLSGPQPAQADSLNSVVVNTRTRKQSHDRPELIDIRNMTDRGTGENWKFKGTRSDQFNFLGGDHRYMIHSRSAYRLLYQRKIRGEARSVFDWLLEHALFNSNIVAGVSHKQIAGDTAVSRPNVSLGIIKLERERFLLRDGPGKILINPYLWFVGTPGFQHKVCDEWDQKMAARELALAAAGASEAAEAESLEETTV